MKEIKNVDALLEYLEQGVTGQEITDEIGESPEFMAALAAYFGGTMNTLNEATEFHKAAKQFRLLAIEKIVERKYNKMRKEESE